MGVERSLCDDRLDLVPAWANTCCCHVPLGMVYSHRKVGQPGKITRLMSCTDEQWEAFPGKDLVPTHRVCATL